MKQYDELILNYGKDVLRSPGMQKEKTFLQHGTVSVYAHSLAVTRTCVRMDLALHLHADLRTLIRGALLHDYFLYDWHDPDPSHRWHGFIHPRISLRNARRDFTLNAKEENMIRSHMFPMVLPIPRCRESVILCLADKYCALKETLFCRKHRKG